MLLGFCFTWRWQIPERMCMSKEKAHWGERNGGGKVSGHVRNSQVLEKAEGGFLHALYASKGLSITSGLLTPCCCCNKSPQRWWLKQHQRVLLQLRNLKSLSCGWSYSVGRAVFLLEGPWECFSPPPAWRGCPQSLACGPCLHLQISLCFYCLFYIRILGHGWTHPDSPG